jgi:hypothetical protein
MSSARLMTAASTSTARLAADVAAVHGLQTSRAPVVDRLAEALGREFAERVVAMLSKDALNRLDLGLTPGFVDRLAVLRGGFSPDQPARFAGDAARELTRGRLGHAVA